MERKTAHPVDSLIEELQGHLELNMEKEARRIIRELLRHPHLNAEGFCEAGRGIGMGKQAPRLWRPLVEAAYQKLASKEKRKAGAAMLSYYFTIDEEEFALPFCKLRDLHSSGDLMFAMKVLLESGKLLEAKQVANKCRRALRSEISSFDASCLLEALGCYYARTRQWQRASKLWSNAPRDEPMGGEAAIRCVELFVAGGLDAIAGELSIIESRKKKPLAGLALILPGLEDSILEDTEKELLRFRRGLERLVSEKTRVAFGL